MQSTGTKDTDILFPAPLLHITEVQPFSEADGPLLEELTQVLQRHGALNRIGLALLHQHFSTDPGEILVEETDVAARVQTIKPQRESEVKGPYVETILRLDTGKPLGVCICANYGSGHMHWQR